MRNKNEGKSPTARMLLGRRGEDVACGFLEGMGHRILRRNYRSGHLEIDIISTDGNGVHFVEVKSRTAPVETDPEEKVDALKQKKICAAALRYLASGRTTGDREVFFDIISVVFEGGSHTLRYFPEAWIPMYT